MKGLLRRCGLLSTFRSDGGGRALVKARIAGNALKTYVVFGVVAFVVWLLITQKWCVGEDLGGESWTETPDYVPEWAGAPSPPSEGGDADGEEYAE